MPAITDFTAGYAITPRLDHPIIGSQHQIRDAETKFQANLEHNLKLYISDTEDHGDDHQRAKKCEIARTFANENKYLSAEEKLNEMRQPTFLRAVSLLGKMRLDPILMDTEEDLSADFLNYTLLALAHPDPRKLGELNSLVIPNQLVTHCMENRVPFAIFYNTQAGKKFWATQEKPMPVFDCGASMLSTSHSSEAGAQGPVEAAEKPAAASAIAGSKGRTLKPAAPAPANVGIFHPPASSMMPKFTPSPTKQTALLPLGTRTQTSRAISRSAEIDQFKTEHLDPQKVEFAPRFEEDLKQLLVYPNQSQNALKQLAKIVQDLGRSDHSKMIAGYHVVDLTGVSGAKGRGTHRVFYRQIDDRYRLESIGGHDGDNGAYTFRF